MAQHRLGKRSAVATALLTGAVTLTGCGGVSFGGTAAPTSVRADAPSTSGSASASATEPATTSSATSATTPSASTTSPRPSPASPATRTPAKPSRTTAASPRHTTPATPKPSVSPATRKPVPVPPTTQPPAAPQDGQTLHVGDSGAYVHRVQERLAALGYWNGTPDGTYGGLTAQAVMALQKATGLGRDGVFGPATRRALEAGVRPGSRIGGSGIEIDKARQLLLVVRGGAVTTILNTSTGSGQHYDYQGVDRVANTPAGTYSTFRSVDHLDKGPLGDLWRPRYFNGGIAVHGAGNVPGYPASHGCARVSNPAMDMIWATGLMPIGGRVVVY
ncbi:L,D-transpeptidase family protein [Pedococcus sp. 5OH_020]|uniref:L,D-transpeptidase family protein n=1 Tax=Pedococcus sp. 5OH_020 TaxID=2989814 RepID=UPI0022E9E74C|nr:L,D-transpeptidase family protein [Pedococcus sp. 5OH_020]